MPPSASRKPTDHYEHGSAKRANLPTQETSPTMGAEDRAPVVHLPEARERDHEPILAWNRQPPPADQGHAAYPLYVREKVHPAAFVKLLQSGGEHPQLFEDFNGLPHENAAYEWYEHAANWSNRIIHGESTRVMASLLARESMAGKVQMIYFDPPYGMGYKANFQVAINNRETPEAARGRPHDTRTIRAFRDTYDRGIHSYLDLTREKLILMRELLADTGSLFMQIGDENVHRAAVLLDEVFGSENRVVTIPYATAGGSSAKTLPSVADFLLWYAKDRENVKYHQLYESLTRAEKIEHMSSYAMVELSDGSTRPPTDHERGDPDSYLPDGARLYRRMRLCSPGTSATRSDPYFWNGHSWPCPPNEQWRVSMEGMDRLAELGRLDAAGPNSRLAWKRYENEVPGRRIHNVWSQQMSVSDKRYVVQTADSVIERCILMATDPGDLVFDPTCGGATTAVAAEEWGRRWITCDTSPIAVAIARQRLATTTFPYWTLADSAEGAKAEAKLSRPSHTKSGRGRRESAGATAGTKPSRVQDRRAEITEPLNGWSNDPAGGFVCERVPRVSAGVLAYDLDPDPIMLVDKPHRTRGVIRVASPLTVESEQPWATVLPFEGDDDGSGDGDDSHDDFAAVAHGDFLQAVEAALLHHTIKGGRDDAHMTIGSLEPWPDDSKLLAWKATYTVGSGAAEYIAAVMVADEDVTVPGEMIREAARDVATSPERTDRVLVVANAFGPDTPDQVGRFHVTRAQMNRDLMIRELSAETGHQAFVILGQPDIRTIHLSRKSEVGSRKSEVGSRKSEVGSRKSEVGSRKSEVGSRKSEVGSRKSEVGSRKSEVGQVAVEIQGYDTYDPATGNAAAGGPDDVACWMVDTDHDGESFFARRIHFPGAQNDKLIKKLIKTLGKSANEVERQALTALRSAPFDRPKSGRIAVKIVTTTGMEMTKVLHLDDPNPT